MDQKMLIYLNEQEIGELDRQNPATRKNGGFQVMLVDFQFRINHCGEDEVWGTPFIE